MIGFAHSGLTASIREAHKNEVVVVAMPPSHGPSESFLKATQEFAKFTGETYGAIGEIISFSDAIKPKIEIPTSKYHK